ERGRRIPGRPGMSSARLTGPAPNPAPAPGPKPSAERPTPSPSPAPKPKAEAPKPSLGAITFDYGDTLYHGHVLPERVRYRQEALHGMLASLGRELEWPEFEALYIESGREAARWWREEARGYHTRDRIRWILERLEIDHQPDDSEHMAAAVTAVDEALLRWPAPLITGVSDLLRDLAGRTRLGIVSDTGFASGTAQNTLLERDGLLEHFAVTTYSMDLGHAKPRREPFVHALDAL